MGSSKKKGYSNPALQKAEQLLAEADGLITEAMKLRNQAVDIFHQETIRAQREQNDRLINKKKAMKMLGTKHHSTLWRWCKQVNKYGYLNFTNNKILRSEVLRYIDDLQSNKINELLYSKKK